MDRINGADHVDIGGGRRGFRDEALDTGVVGTEVTAEWLNGIQEELMALIEGSGLAGTSASWNMVAKALLSKSLQTKVSTGTASAFVVDLPIAPPALVDGLEITILPHVTPNAGATVNLNGLGPEPILWADGVAIAKGDAIALLPLVLRYSTVLSAWVISAHKSSRSPWFQMSGTPNNIPNAVNTALNGWPTLVSGGVAGTLSASTGIFTAAEADAGTWIFTASSNTQGASSLESVMLYKNGAVSDLQSQQGNSAENGRDPEITAMMRVASGDQIYAAYYQNSGGFQTMNTNGTSKFAGVRIGA